MGDPSATEWEWWDSNPRRHFQRSPGLQPGAIAAMRHSHVSSSQDAPLLRYAVMRLEFGRNLVPGATEPWVPASASLLRKAHVSLCCWLGEALVASRCFPVDHVISRGPCCPSVVMGTLLTCWQRREKENGSLPGSPCWESGTSYR